MPDRMVPTNERGYVIGEAHHRARLSDAEVRAMRDLHEGPDRLTYAQLAERFGVSVSHAAKVCRCERRNNVAHGWRRVRLNIEAPDQ